jgi:hypothetical protein
VEILPFYFRFAFFLLKCYQRITVAFFPMPTCGVRGMISGCTVSENSIINLLPSQEDYLLNKIFPREYTLGRENLLQVEEEAKKFCSNFRYSSFLFGVSVPNPFSVRLPDPDPYPEGKTCRYPVSNTIYNRYAVRVFLRYKVYHYNDLFLNN